MLSRCAGVGREIQTPGPRGAAGLPRRLPFPIRFVGLVTKAFAEVAEHHADNNSVDLQECPSEMLFRQMRQSTQVTAVESYWTAAAVSLASTQVAPSCPTLHVIDPVACIWPESSGG